MLAARLKCTLVLNGDGTDLEFLESENVGRSDVLVCVIDNDERNLLASLLGRQLGVPKIVTRVSRPTNLRLFERVGIDVALSARGAAVASILHQITGGTSSLLAVLEHGEARVLELIVSPRFEPKPLKGIGAPGDAIVGAILRGGTRSCRAATIASSPAIASSCFRRATPPIACRRISVAPATDRARMRLSLVVHVIGLVVRVFGLMFLAPLAGGAGLWRVRRRDRFCVVTVVTSAIGHLMRQAGGPAAEDAVEAHAARRGTGDCVWCVAGDRLVRGRAVSCGTGSARSTRMFESMSGLTTTGATVFRDFSLYGRGIFFWRGTDNWLGGMGVIALFVAILPRLAIGGREIFFAEASGPDEEKVAPQIRRTAALLWRLYAALTLLQIIALMMTGMPLFDSICNTFGTIAAAGFSPHPLSIAGYQNPAAEWVIIVFMFLAGANFALQYRALATRDFKLFGDDEELRAYAGVVLAATAMVAFAIWGSRRRGRADSHGAVPGAVDHHHHRLRERGFQPLERSGQSGAARADVHRRLRRIRRRRPEGGAARAAGASSRCRSCGARCTRARCCR